MIVVARGCREMFVVETKETHQSSHIDLVIALGIIVKMNIFPVDLFPAAIHPVASIRNCCVLRYIHLIN